MAKPDLNLDKAIFIVIPKGADKNDPNTFLQIYADGHFTGYPPGGGMVINRIAGLVAYIRELEMELHLRRDRSND